MKALEDFDTSGKRWIKGHYLWPNFIELDAEVMEEKAAEHCSKCNIPLGTSNPPSYTCFSSCPCHELPDGNTTIKLDPSPRIDYCSACDAEHGYECPKDTKKHSVRLRLGTSCMKCDKQFCSCPERQLDGSWSAPKPKKIEKMNAVPEEDRFTWKNGFNVIAGKLNEIIERLNEI